MNKKELMEIALRYVEKSYDCEQLRDGDEIPLMKMGSMGVNGVGLIEGDEVVSVIEVFVEE